MEKARQHFVWRMFMVVGITVGVVFPYWWLPLLALGVTLVAGLVAVLRGDTR